MFGLSFTELLIIAVLALILLGPDKLPDAMKTMGKGLREFQKATQDLKDQIEDEVFADERKASKPALVPPVPAASSPVRPTDPPGPTPAATAENVPGLEAALAEPSAPRPDQTPAPEAKSS
jgi:sec-independent protein translocase protein TatB